MLFDHCHVKFNTEEIDTCEKTSLSSKVIFLGTEKNKYQTSYRFIVYNSSILHIIFIKMLAFCTISQRIFRPTATYTEKKSKKSDDYSLNFLDYSDEHQ